MSSQFDIAKDCAVVAQGGFFCRACLTGKPAREQSPDPRYCQGCFVFLADEAALLPPGKGGRWIPRGCRQVDPGPGPRMPSTARNTSEDTVAETDIGAAPLPAPVAILQRGRRALELPVDEIRVLVGQGVSLREISRLLEQRGIVVSPATLSRRLQGSLTEAVPCP